MQGLGITIPSLLGSAPIGQVSRSQSEVFALLYNTFLILGTIVGVVVISYILYNVYKYRSDGAEAGRYDIEEGGKEEEKYDVARPEQGVIPTGQGKGGGKKLFLSFSLSAILVLGLIIFSYTMLLQVESAPEDADWEVDVLGERYGWDYQYPHGINTTDDEWQNPSADRYEYVEYESDQQANKPALVMPKGHVTAFTVTSRDVWHNFGIPEMRAKSDAIPEQTTETWAMPEEVGMYDANCYELCGEGHSNMKGPVIVMEPTDFAQWYSQFSSVTEEDLQFLDLEEDQLQQITGNEQSIDNQEADNE
jgi:cytochrome c oxidase subunit 2